MSQNIIIDIYRGHIFNQREERMNWSSVSATRGMYAREARKGRHED